MSHCSSVFDDGGWIDSSGRLQDDIAEFLELYERRPIRHNEGGVQEVGAFTLWYFLKRIEPELVIESGVWKGQTTWLIEQTLPDSRLICFDPNRRMRVYQSDAAEYPHGDFAGYRRPPLDSDRALVFFDDHRTRSSA